MSTIASGNLVLQFHAGAPSYWVAIEAEDTLTADGVSRLADELRAVAAELDERVALMAVIAS